MSSGSRLRRSWLGLGAAVMVASALAGALAFAASGSSTARSSAADAAARVRFTSLSISGHVCAVTTAGGVMCLGQNTNGELGDGTHLRRPLGHAPPVAVKHLPERVTAVAAG